MTLEGAGMSRIGIGGAARAFGLVGRERLEVDKNYSTPGAIDSSGVRTPKARRQQ